MKVFCAWRETKANLYFAEISVKLLAFLVPQMTWCGFIVFLDLLLHVS